MRSRVLLLLLCLSECCGQEYLYQDIEEEEADDDYYTDFYYNYAGDTTPTDQPTRTPDRLFRAKFTLKNYWPGQRYKLVNGTWALGSKPNEQQWQSLSAVFDDYFSRAMSNVARDGDIFMNLDNFTTFTPTTTLKPTGPPTQPTPANADKATLSSLSRRRPKRPRITKKTTTTMSPVYISTAIDDVENRFPFEIATEVVAISTISSTSITSITSITATTATTIAGSNILSTIFESPAETTIESIRSTTSTRIMDKGGDDSGYGSGDGGGVAGGGGGGGGGGSGGGGGGGGGGDGGGGSGGGDGGGDSGGDGGGGGGGGGDGGGGSGGGDSGGDSGGDGGGDGGGVAGGGVAGGGGGGVAGGGGGGVAGGGGGGDSGDDGAGPAPTGPVDGTWYPPWVHTYWADGVPHTYPNRIYINGSWHKLPDDWPYHTTHTCPPYTPVTTTTTTTTRPPTLRLDIVGLLSVIANLTYFYDMNLTERFNETLMKYGVPTCGTPTTSLTPSPTTPVFNFANTTIVGKCFVCGLDKEEIPQDAYCADAFAGDFLPLNPVDARARGKIARYRKYCRYLDVRSYELNPDEPRAVYGRFTGGCSVRWTDLSGVYTQRTCRNKRRAVLGKHFASKRMAKLEMALNNVDNGCIISPMATLLPLSRGVSLYARFHACVCTGAWCNRAARHDPWMLNLLLPFWFYRSR